MPFDPVPQTLTLADLSWRLRHPETWPAGFAWDYGRCASCAIGLAWRLTMPTNKRKPKYWEGWLVEQFPDCCNKKSRFLDAVVCSIFFLLHHGHDCRPSKITPVMVADAIDAWLDTKGE